jgi:hypothetical protein
VVGASASGARCCIALCVLARRGSIAGSLPLLPDDAAENTGMQTCANLQYLPARCISITVRGLVDLEQTVEGQPAPFLSRFRRPSVFSPTGDLSCHPWKGPTGTVWNVPRTGYFRSFGRGDRNKPKVSGVGRGARVQVSATESGPTHHGPGVDSMQCPSLVAPHCFCPSSTGPTSAAERSSDVPCIGPSRASRMESLFGSVQNKKRGESDEACFCFFLVRDRC